jgi:hypothetical protein
MSSKKLLTVISMIVACHCHAQEQSVTNNTSLRTVAKASIVPLFYDTYEMGVERFNRTLSKSIQASVGYRLRSDEYDEAYGITFDLAYRKYFTSIAKNPGLFSGAYYSFFLGGGYYEGTAYSVHTVIYSDGRTVSSDQWATEFIKAICPGVSIGIQKRFARVMFLDLNVGGGYRFTRTTYDASYFPYFYYGPNEHPYEEMGYTGIYPKAEVKIGIGL